MVVSSISFQSDIVPYQLPDHTKTISDDREVFAQFEFVQKLCRVYVHKAQSSVVCVQCALYMHYVLE